MPNSGCLHSHRTKLLPSRLIDGRTKLGADLCGVKFSVGLERVGQLLSLAMPILECGGKRSATPLWIRRTRESGTLGQPVRQNRSNAPPNRSFTSRSISAVVG